MLTVWTSLSLDERPVSRRNEGICGWAAVYVSMTKSIKTHSLSVDTITFPIHFHHWPPNQITLILSPHADVKFFGIHKELMMKYLCTQCKQAIMHYITDLFDPYISVWYTVLSMGILRLTRGNYRSSNLASPSDETIENLKWSTVRWKTPSCQSSHTPSPLIPFKRCEPKLDPLKLFEVD